MIINFSNIIDTPEKLFRNISQQSIYEYYLNTNIKKGVLYKCPFHKDHTPSLGFKLYNDDILMYKCFACGASGNTISFVSNLHNLSYKEAFNKILEDRHDLPKIKTTILKKESKNILLPIKRNFNLIDYNYWNSYYISLELLRKYDIFACQKVFYKKEDEYIPYADHIDSDPIYCYQIDDSHKIYRPLHKTKKGKWMSSTQIEDIQGMKQLPKNGDLLIITSSMKDLLVLKVLGYNAIALGGEGNKVPKKILDYLSASFKEIVIFYDNDMAGINYGKKLSTDIGVNYIYIPTEYEDTKDISDFIKKYGLTRTKQLIQELLNGRKEGV